MATKRLTYSSQTPIVTLEMSAEQSVDHIEVPAGESRFHILQNDSGNQLQHYVFHLRHPGSTVWVTGQVEVAGESTPSLTTDIIHHVPETRAETLIRTLSAEQAAPRYQGLIHILPGAQNCESYLNHHSLLLGERAKSWTLPSLEIEADQVKCSHAATIRTLTELDLFYLRSRGLDRASAEKLLIEAFLAEQ